MKNYFEITKIDKIFLIITVFIIAIGVIGILILKGTILTGGVGSKAIQGKWVYYNSVINSENRITHIKIYKDKIVTVSKNGREEFKNYDIKFFKNERNNVKINTEKYEIRMVFKNSYFEKSCHVFIVNKELPADATDRITHALFVKMKIDEFDN